MKAGGNRSTRGLCGWLALLLLLGGWLPTTAQAVEDPEIDRSNIPLVQVPRFAGDATREAQLVTRQMAWFEDASQVMDLSQARERRTWRLSGLDSFRPGYSTSAYWMQIRLVNNTPNRRSVVVDFGGARQDYMDWYLLSPGGNEYARGRLGNRLPLDVRDLPVRVLAIPLDLLPNSQADLYIRVMSHDGWNYIFRPTLSSQETFTASLLETDHTRGLLLGAMLAFALMGFVGYVTTRAPIALWQALYGLASVGYCMAEMSYDLAYLWPQWPRWHVQFVFYSGCLAVVTYSMFVNSFLRPADSLPRVLVSSRKVLILLSLLSVTPVFFDEIALAINTTLVIALLLLHTSILAIWQAFRQVPGAMYVAAGFMLQFTVIALVVLRYLGVIRSGSYDQGLLLWTVTFNLGLSTFALMVSVQRWRLGKLRAERRARKIAQELQARDAIEQRRDRLTGLPNRLALDEWLARRVADSRPFAVLHVRTDVGRGVWGQQDETAVEQALQLVAKHCTTFQGEHDFLARGVNDEFVMVLQSADLTQAVGVAQSLVSRLQHPVPGSSGPRVLALSAGIALFPAHTQDPIQLRQFALVALQEARELGVGVQVYRPGSEIARVRRNALLNDLMGACENGQLSLHYQPKLDLKAGRVLAAEALMRWHHPLYGAVAPTEFIRLAEQSESMRPLTQWALETAVAQLALWRDEGLDIDLAVNLSVQDLQLRELPGELGALLDRYGVRASALTLEITEGSAMQETATSRRVLADLHELGVSMSLDDFGTGWSSLSTLQRLSLAEVKVDQMFVRPLDAEGGAGGNAAIVRATTDMAHALSLGVVCEGVETAATASLLQSWGCDSLQGYWIARPMPASDLVAWLQWKKDDHCMRMLSTMAA